MKKAFITLSLALTLVGGFSIPAFADTVSGVNITNNTLKSSDYKLSQDEAKKLEDKINTNTQYKELFDENNGRDINGLSTEYAWLIEHNIITREGSLSQSGDNVNLGIKQNTNLFANKGNFLMDLYKAEFGVIPSRPVVFNTPAYRDIDGAKTNVIVTDKYKPKGYTGNSTTFNFGTGDYNVYVSPNVNELYFSKLLDKGILKDSDFKDKEFIKEYNANGKTYNGKTYYAQWSNNLAPYTPNTGQQPTSYVNAGGSPLGKCWDIKGYSNNSNTPMSSFEATRNDADFFVNNEISTKDALRYIEKVLRLKEKDMSDLEAKTVVYKYGTPYMLNVPQDMKCTVTYLIAMGIIDFNDAKEFGALGGTLREDFARTLLYRVGNKAGRLDFSKIHLTDMETQLMNMGYIENNFKIYKSNGVAEPETVSVSETKNEMASAKPTGLFAMLGLTPNPRAVQYGAGQKTFSVVKKIFDPDKVTYWGVALTQTDWDKAKENHYTKLKEADGWMIVRFDVQATDENAAILQVDSQLSVANTEGKVQAVKTITTIQNDGKEISYISKTELEDKLSEIQVLNDKTLKNKATGTMGIILDDHNIAMIGNSVVRSASPMMKVINNEVYYNFNLVVKMMTNAYISKIAESTVMLNKPLMNETMAKVCAGENNAVIEHTPVINLAEDSHFDQTHALPNTPMYNVNMLTRGVSTLVRRFTVKANGHDVSMDVVVNWGYYMPDDEKSIEALNKEIGGGGDAYTIKKASKFLYTRPSGGDAQKVWDNNMVLSNSLANFIYGTKDAPYIKSGYMTPNLSILVQTDDGGTKDAAVNELFKRFTLPDSFVKSELGGDVGNWKNLFNGKSGASKYRNLEILTGKSSDGDWVYNNKYLTTSYGAVYRAVADDNRIHVNPSDPATIFVNTRSSSKNITGADKTVITYNGHKYYINGTDKSGRYYRLTSLDPVQGVKSTSAATIVNGRGEDVINPDISKNRDVFGVDSTLEPNNGNSKTSLLPVKYLKDATYLVDGQFQQITETSKSNYKSTTVSEPGVVVLAFTNVYVDATKYSFHNGKAYKGSVNPYEQAGNVFFSGLNNSMINRLMEVNGKADTADNLPIGAKVIIQDASYTVQRGGYLVSDPINNKTLASNIASVAYQPKQVEKQILKYYTGLMLYYSGRPVPFSSYITDAGLGALKDSSKANATICGTSKNPGFVDKGGKSMPFDSSCTPKSAVISLKVDGNVKFVCIDKENQIYTLLYDAAQYSNGYLDNVSFFAERLELTTNDDLFLGLDKVLFQPLHNFQKLLDKFMQEYRAALNGDFKALVKIVLMSLFAYLFIISWVCYAIVKHNLGREFFLMIRDPLRSGESRGPDVIKWISFTMYSIDDLDPTFFRQVVGSFLFFCALCALLIWA